MLISKKLSSKELECVKAALSNEIITSDLVVLLRYRFTFSILDAIFLNLLLIIFVVNLSPRMGAATKM